MPPTVLTRRQTVRDLVASGLSRRQVAAIVGVSHTTVTNDLRTPPERAPPAPRVVHLHCLHCRHPVVSRPRGLCWACFHRPGVREQYPPVSQYGRRGLGHEPSKRLPAPTSARPGTPEKVEVLAARAANGEALFHPHDAA